MPSRRALWFLVGVVLVVYVRLLSASFVEFDDDFHVYANPFLNPPSLHGLGELFRHSYKGLYNPLVYAIWSAIGVFAQVPGETTSSLGQPIHFDPAWFHAANIGFHALNAVLCYLLALELMRRETAALLCALVFAVHPLQVESVGWISELRGVSGGSFALGALILLVRSRRAGTQDPRKQAGLLGVSALLVLGAVLCKAAAVVLPVVALIVDRVALGTAWRRALTTALAWAAAVLPIALITLLVQNVAPVAATAWWQRPFIAGDALAFYLLKTAVPLDLGVEYGRTPYEALSESWGYATWILPALLLALAFVKRRSRPLAWLGALLFVAFASPTLGLVPFAFQAHSSVADRYTYLPMLGIGLVAADAVMAAGSSLALRVAAGVVLVLGIRSFDQTSYWLDNVSFLRHTLDVNSDVAFAQNNLANVLFKEGRNDEALEHFEKALAIEPGHALAHNNLGLALLQKGRFDEAEPHFRKAVELDPKYYKALESLGAVYLKTNRLAEAITSLRAAIALHPEAKPLNDLGIALMQSGKPNEGLDAFRRAVALEPGNAQYRKNLGTALTQVGRNEEAAEYLGR